MIVEIDTNLLDKLGDSISINQLVFLTLVLSKSQKNCQGLRSLFSRLNDNEIQELIDLGYVSKSQDAQQTIYSPTILLTEKIGKEEDLFDQFFALYPVYVDRPDGTKDYLRSNLNKCRAFYKTICGKSKSNHERIIECLKYDLDKKSTNGKLSYMKRMWQWLTSREWESIEQEMIDSKDKPIQQTYGTNVQW